MNARQEALYEILGVNPNATIDAIKTSYRKLSLKHHPDRGGDANVFRAIAEAFAVLSDESARCEYDATGKVPSVKQQASRVESGIAAMTMAAFSQEKTDPITWMLGDIDCRRSRIQAERSECQQLLTKLEKSLRKFLEDNQGTNNSQAFEFIAMSIEVRIQEVNEGISQATDDIEHLTEMTKYLNGLFRQKRSGFSSAHNYGPGYSFGMLGQ